MKFRRWTDLRGSFGKSKRNLLIGGTRRSSYATSRYSPPAIRGNKELRGFGGNRKISDVRLRMPSQKKDEDIEDCEKDNMGAGHSISENCTLRSKSVKKRA